MVFPLLPHSPRLFSEQPARILLLMSCPTLDSRCSCTVRSQYGPGLRPPVSEFLLPLGLPPAVCPERLSGTVVERLKLTMVAAYSNHDAHSFRTTVESPRRTYLSQECCKELPSQGGQQLLGVVLGCPSLLKDLTNPHGGPQLCTSVLGVGRC